MDRDHLPITARERQALREQYRKGVNGRLRLRAHLLLFLAPGYAWAVSAGVRFWSTRTIARWKSRVESAGSSAVRGPAPPSTSRLGKWWSAGGAQGGRKWSPHDLGFLRTRWGCGVIVLVVLETDELEGSRETVRRWLPQAQSGWRRPRPVVGPRDPQRALKLQRLRQLLATLPAHAMAVCQAEGDLTPTPKLGARWLRRGRQAPVVTPGITEKRSLAGALNWRTGALRGTERLPQEGRRATRFLRPLEDWRRRLLGSRKIPVICDKARSHQCRAVQSYLQRWQPRLVLHFFPTYAPETNPIERLWWHLHEEITRCQRCQSLEELLDLVFAGLPNRAPFVVEDAVYSLPQAA
jgi:putative transposase